MQAAACGGGTGATSDVVAPPVDPLATIPGIYALAAVDGQRLPVETSHTAGEADTLVADTLSLSGRVDSSVARKRVVRWFAFGGLYAGHHEATFADYDGGWRVRDGKPFIWVLFNHDSVPVSVPDVETVAFTRQGHRYVYKR